VIEGDMRGRPCEEGIFGFYHRICVEGKPMTSYPEGVTYGSSMIKYISLPRRGSTA